MTNELTDYESLGALDTSDPNSIISKLPKHATKLKEALTTASNANGYEDNILDKDWRKAYGYSKDYKIMRLLRLSFWNEYKQAISLGKDISVPRIFTGVCSARQFYKLLNHEMNQVFLMSQPQNLAVIQEDLISLGYEQIYEILTMDNFDDNGNPNVKLIQEKNKIIGQLEDRRHGSVVHRSQVHQKSEVTTTTKTIDEASKEDLKQQLKELEMELVNNSEDKKESIQVEYQEVNE